MKNRTKTTEEIIAYLTGNCSQEERVIFENWLDIASDGELAAYQSIERTWNQVDLHSRKFEPDIQNAWDQLQLKVHMRSDKRPFPWMAAAAILAILTLTAMMIWSEVNFIPAKINKVATNKVEHIILPDGSEVWLSPNSSLTYTSDFSDDSRKVNLKGKAFFEIAKRNGKRFTVYTKTTKTEVLGTSFHLDAHFEEEVSIQVASGKVAFSDIAVKEMVLLTPGKEAIYQPLAKKKITSTAIANHNYRAWQNKKLTFNNSNIAELTKTLEEFYHTNIETAEQLHGCRFTASFDHQSLEEVLTVLEITADLKIEKLESGYHITGNPCN